MQNSIPDDRRRNRTLGPVSDLERHLPEEWWKTLFSAMYLQTDGDVVENETNTRDDIDALLDAVSFGPSDRILDLCCGQGRHSIELAVRGFASVTGIDRSRYLVRLARQRAKKRGVGVLFHEGDARKFRLPREPYDAIMLLGNSFGYFEAPEDDLRVLERCRQALDDSGTLVIDFTDGDWMRDNFAPRSWEWIDENHFVCRERELASDENRLVSREVVTHVERGVIVDQFYAERLYDEESIGSLLVRAGFEQIRFRPPQSSRSTREQDLGMMSRRLLLTARAGDRSRVRQVRARQKHITVLLGDPRRDDTIKLEGRFNKDDHETVDRLKVALDALDGYTFSLMDDHGVMLDELRSSPPDFVLNLCDEGFNNDALLELHVPAYLEMLGVPFTGSGPACLGFCYNKSLVRAVAAAHEIPVPLETMYSPSDQSATLPGAFPALVKPNFGDGSLGISATAVVHNPQELVAHLNELRRQLGDRPLLVQEFLPGTEYSIAIVGNPGISIRSLPLLEVDYSELDEGLPHLLGYESKWDPESPYWTKVKFKKSTLDVEATRTLIDYSMTLFEQLGCRDYARFDYRTDANGVIKLLEVNPNPGWCWDGKLNLMAEFEGLTYPDLLRLILESAHERYSYARPHKPFAPEHNSLSFSH